MGLFEFDILVAHQMLMSKRHLDILIWRSTDDFRGGVTDLTFSK